MLTGGTIHKRFTLKFISAMVVAAVKSTSGMPVRVAWPICKVTRASMPTKAAQDALNRRSHPPGLFDPLVVWGQKDDEQDRGRKMVTVATPAPKSPGSGTFIENALFGSRLGKVI
jgi:hypothetical protein